ncbi:MAG: glycosyltransferase [Chloroflexi bacterium]|nr:glycosyltransferase [Chloroflexota bacterium]
MEGLPRERVTIGIDTYNSAHLLGRAIDSALAQTYPADLVEILVVDDGSTDGTPAVVSRYGGRVRFARKANGGQASAINEVVRLATGDIICLLDGDDYFYPDKVRRVVEAFARDEAVGLVYNRFDIVAGDGTVLERGYPASMPAGDLAWPTLLGYSWGCVTSAMSVRASVARSVRIPEEPFRVSADYFLASILPLLTRVGVVEEPSSAWVSHGQNALLGNPAGSSRELHHRHKAAIRRYARQTLGREFVTYGGRGGYGTPDEAPRGLDRWRVFLRETRVIALAPVGARLKARAQLKAAAALLPEGWYGRVRQAVGDSPLTPGPSPSGGEGRFVPDTAGGISPFPLGGVLDKEGDEGGRTRW